MKLYRYVLGVLALASCKPLPGTDGVAGESGKDGVAGESVLSATLAFGDPHCPYGGIQFTVGSTVTFACNGTPGIQGPPSALPWVDAGSSVVDAVGRIGSVTTTVLISNEQDISTNFTIPSNVQLMVLSTGTIRINPSATLTINGSFTASHTTVFTGSGAVIFAAGSVDAAFPEWWGADRNGVADSSGALQNCARTVQGTAAKMVLTSMFLIKTPIVVSRTLNIEGGGINTGLINETVAGDAALIVDGTGALFPYAYHSRFSNFTIRGNGISSGSGIKVANLAAYSVFDHIYSVGNNHGFWYSSPENMTDVGWGTGYGAMFIACIAKSNYGDGYLDNTTGNPNPYAQWIGCIAEGNQHGINWASDQVTVLGGAYESNMVNEMVFTRGASVMGAGFEESKPSYGDRPMLLLRGYGSTAQGNTFAVNDTEHIRGIQYEAALVSIESNVFHGRNPSASIGIYNNATIFGIPQANSGSRIRANVNNGFELTQSLGLEQNFDDTALALTPIANFSAIHTVGNITLGNPGSATNNSIAMGFCPSVNAANSSIFFDSSTGKPAFRASNGDIYDFSITKR